MTQRIGIASLLKGRTGSLPLPEEVFMHCPQCGSGVVDKGQCVAELVAVPETVPSVKPKREVRLVVSCRVCGCEGKSPVVDM